MPNSTRNDWGRVLARLDFPANRRQPQLAPLLLSGSVALLGSLLADVLLVALGTALFPHIRHFSHFRPSDYGTLTVIGVVAACTAWPITTRVTSSPRWLYFRMAVGVTLVLFAPDLWILLGGEPVRAVLVLMTMHLAIAAVTYNAVVRIAAVEPDGAPSEAGATRKEEVAWKGPVAVVSSPAGLRDPSSTAGPRERAPWIAMSLLCVAEFALGIAVMFSVRAGRASGLVPSVGTIFYLAHAAFGLLLVLGAGLLFLASRRESRWTRISADAGAVGVCLGAIGGGFATIHGIRVVGMLLMFLGAALGAISFGLPVVPPNEALVGRSYDVTDGLGSTEPSGGVSTEESVDQWGNPRRPWKQGTG